MPRRLKKYVPPKAGDKSKQSTGNPEKSKDNPEKSEHEPPPTRPLPFSRECPSREKRCMLEMFVASNPSAIAAAEAEAEAEATKERDRVMIIGAATHVGQATVLKALEDGYNVHAIFNSHEEVVRFYAAFPPEFIFRVHDSVLPSLKHLDTLVGGAKYIIYTESPEPWGNLEGLDESYAIQKCAIWGLVLAAAYKCSCVKRVVCTVGMSPYSGPVRMKILMRLRDADDSKNDSEGFRIQEMVTDAYNLGQLTLTDFGGKLEELDPMRRVDVVYLFVPSVFGPNLMTSLPDQFLVGTNAILMQHLFGYTNQPLLAASVHIDDVATCHVDSLLPCIPPGCYALHTSTNWPEAIKIVEKYHPTLVGTMFPKKPRVRSFRINFTAERRHRVRHFWLKFKSFEEQVKDTVDYFLLLLAQNNTTELLAPWKLNRPAPTHIKLYTPFPGYYLSNLALGCLIYVEGDPQTDSTNGEGSQSKQREFWSIRIRSRNGEDSGPCQVICEVIDFDSGEALPRLFNARNCMSRKGGKAPIEDTGGSSQGPVYQVMRIKCVKLKGGRTQLGPDPKGNQSDPSKSTPSQVSQPDNTKVRLRATEDVVLLPEPSQFRSTEDKGNQSDRSEYCARPLKSLQSSKNQLRARRDKEIPATAPNCATPRVGSPKSMEVQSGPAADEHATPCRSPTREEPQSEPAEDEANRSEGSIYETPCKSPTGENSQSEATTGEGTQSERSVYATPWAETPAGKTSQSGPVEDAASQSYSSEDEGFASATGSSTGKDSRSGPREDTGSQSDSSEDEVFISAPPSPIRQSHESHC